MSEHPNHLQESPAQSDSQSDAATHDLMSRIVETFLRGNLSILLVIISLIAGVVALIVTPREEDPQIIVPLADVMVSMPGASAQEVERQVATRLEKLLYQIDGVEYVYSTSYPGQAIVMVRFYVGQDRERSLVKLTNKIQANIDQIPPGVAGWVVKPVEIDDVPIVNLTLYSNEYNDFELRRMAEELEIRLQAVKNAGRTYIAGGRPRQIQVKLDAALMAGHGVTLAEIERALQGANLSLLGGDLVRTDEAVQLAAGSFLNRADEVGNLVVGVSRMKPVYLKQVAGVTDGPAEVDNYTRISFGPQAFSENDPATHGELSQLPAGIERNRDYPAVTVAVAKRKGTNAVWVSQEVQKAVESFKAEVLPAGVHLRLTRDFGHTANEKVNELIEALVVAIIIIIAILAYTLGWREGLIIALAVPITFSITLLLNYLFGYTINRVTLFALILSLGLVVDDPIVDVENIHRHFAMGLLDPFRAIIKAVQEVRPPIILATLAVIVSFVPMFFITGMMGPYMAPMALNVPIAMLMSLVVAFTITPWLSYHLLRGKKHSGKPVRLEESLMYRFYTRIMQPVFNSRLLRVGILLLMVALLGFAGWLVLTKRVPMKMLPFDNKNELGVVVDMPEGTTLQATEAATAELAEFLARVPEVTDVTTYAGLASPIDFNGLVRHYYLRQGANVADIRFNLAGKKNRSMQSHAIGLRLRNELKQIALRHGANIKIVESPPGPPVISTLVAEVYGSPDRSYQQMARAARQVRTVMETTVGVVDVDDVLVAPQKKLTFQVDRTKAALNQISESQIAQALNGMLAGTSPAALRLDREVNPVRINLQLPRPQRSQPAYLEQITVRGQDGHLVPVGELGEFTESQIEQPIYHKNLRPVVYVFGETAGVPPPETIFTLEGKMKDQTGLAGYEIEWAGEGEWEITIRVFRDLGIAFGVAVLGIYVLLLYQTQSYVLPLIQLVALPLSVIGIMPGFWLLNAVSGGKVDGWGNPVYFTATAMIGIIALAGIATRNAILLIEFVEERKKEGKPLERSLIEAGALRTRAIILTSATALLAAWPITLDPIFSGLAWALIFGVLVSTLFTLVVVPMIYYMVYYGRFIQKQSPISG